MRAQVVGSFVVVSVLQGCTHLDAVKVDAGVMKEEGAPYNLTFTQYELTVKRRLSGCFDAPDGPKKKPNMKVTTTVEATRKEGGGREDKRIAMAFNVASPTHLYGRYWGSLGDFHSLHFETCYYQGIDYCLREGLRVFEPGAQGEHKIARGFLPVLTHSRHHVADPRFAEALRPWCAQERESVLRYRDLVLAHSPYREPPADRPARA